MKRVTACDNEIKGFGAGWEFFDTLIDLRLGMSNGIAKEYCGIDQSLHGMFLLE